MIHIYSTSSILTCWRGRVDRKMWLLVHQGVEIVDGAFFF